MAVPHLQFASHGSYSLSYQDGVLYYAVNGCFNFEGVSRWRDDILMLLDKVGHAPFCVLVDLTRYDGMTQDALPVVNEVNERFNQRQLVAKGYLCASRVKFDMLYGQTPAISAQRGIMFRSVDEARLRLTGLLANAQPA